MYHKIFDSIYSYKEKLFLVSPKNNKKMSGKQIAVMNKNRNCPHRKVLLRYLEESDKKMDLIE